MRSEVLKRLMRRQPAPLLRLHLSNGQTFDIQDPDLAVVTPSTVELILPSDSSATREAIINLLHIIWVEVLTPAS
jgi:hypothetical protein